MEKKEQRTRRVGYGRTEQKEPELMATAGKKAGEEKVAKKGKQKKLVTMEKVGEVGRETKKEIK